MTCTISLIILLQFNRATELKLVRSCFVRASRMTYQNYLTYNNGTNSKKVQSRTLYYFADQRRTINLNDAQIYLGYPVNPKKPSAVFHWFVGSWFISTPLAGREIKFQGRIWFLVHGFVGSASFFVDIALTRDPQAVDRFQEEQKFMVGLIPTQVNSSS